MGIHAKIKVETNVLYAYRENLIFRAVSGKKNRFLIWFLKAERMSRLRRDKGAFEAEQTACAMTTEG